jgi:hypothetical protein
VSEPGLSHFGRALVLVGAAIVVLGLLMLAGDKLGLGKLPGDFTWRGKNTVIHFPIVTSIVVSLALTVLLNLFFSRR